jgi:hypothetical protein
MNELVFSIYKVKLLNTKEVTENPYTIWTKIAKSDNEFEDLDWDKLDESKDFEEFDSSIYYMLDKDEELHDGLMLDEGTYVVDHEYCDERVFKLDDEGNVIEEREEVA